jgi:5'-3' exoribonuclease 1
MPQFELGTPFRPFEQLMGVMPVRSQKMLPEAYRELMYDKGSPILDFYPPTFETDLNGKKNDWEAVVKIPFIDQDRLLKSMHSKEHALTKAERERNEFGDSFVFTYDESIDDPPTYPSPIPDIFPDVLRCHVRVRAYQLPTVHGGIRGLFKGLLPGVCLGKDALPGFPSLATLPHKGQLIRHGVKVFNAESRNDSIILTLETSPAASLDFDSIAQRCLGKRVFVGYVRLPFSLYFFQTLLIFNIDIYCITRQFLVGRF